MALIDHRDDAARGMLAEALSSLFQDEYQEKSFRISDDEIDTLEELSPDKWPTAG